MQNLYFKWSFCSHIIINIFREKSIFTLLICFSLSTCEANSYAFLKQKFLVVSFRICIFTVHSTSFHWILNGSSQSNKQDECYFQALHVFKQHCQIAQLRKFKVKTKSDKISTGCCLNACIMRRQSRVLLKQNSHIFHGRAWFSSIL